MNHLKVMTKAERVDALAERIYVHSVKEDCHEGEGGTLGLLSAAEAYERAEEFEFERQRRWDAWERERSGT